ncbi:MAG: bifunctional phosphoglucose/phosphomannose isomerase [Chloroflexia bacterium]|nr:bifunctional phosphoglucose/phosphomannose isomerase [Chloroflexia bacterium]
MEKQPLPNLDDPQTYLATDPQGAGQRLFDLADQCRRAWELALDWEAPPLPLPPSAIVIAGMGGSAIGGDLLGAWAQSLATVPILVHRDYDLPAYVGPHTLVLASSYSGHTEETLSAARAAVAKGAPWIALTTDGELRRYAREKGLACREFQYKAQPREALGYSLLLLMGTLVRLELLPDPTPQVRSAISTLESLQAEYAPEVPLAQNPAKELACWLYGHLPLVCGSGMLAPVARRWKGQFNENTKSWAVFEVLPEMDHNAVAGTVCPPGFGAAVRAILLSSAYDHERNLCRQRITAKVLARSGVISRALQALGPSPLAQLLSLVLLGDACSYYLAILYGSDPTPIPAIAELKAALAQCT